MLGPLCIFKKIMAINRKEWDKVHYLEYFPSLPCPSCKSGILIRDESTKKLSACNESQNRFKTWQHAGPEDDFGVMSITLRCHGCGEPVIMVSGYSIEEDYGYDDGS